MLTPIFTAISVVVLDQITKFFAQRFLAYSESYPVFTGILHLTLICNKGAAFSIFQGGTFIFVGVAVLCIGVIIFMLIKPHVLSKALGIRADDFLSRISMGLILGGACGNLIDRIRFGCVIDFLDFRVWPVFNIADSAITIGGILIVYKMIRRPN